MPLLTHSKAIKEYWGEVKDKYPHISFERFEDVCRSPFVAIKHWIKDNYLPEIKIKFFGKFKVFAGNVKKAISYNDYLRSKDELTVEEHQQKNKFLNNYLYELNYKTSNVELIDDTDDED